MSLEEFVAPAVDGPLSRNGQSQSSAGREPEWPLFLTRREPPPGAAVPPPLPSVARLWFQHYWAQRSVRALLSAGFTFAAMAGTSAYMLTDSQRRFGPPAPPRALAAPKDTARIAELDQRVTVAADRFAFASHMPGDRVSVEAVGQVEAVSQVDALRQVDMVRQDGVPESLEPNELETGRDLALAPTSEPREADDTADPVAVMILRNLPDTAAFLAGAESADGSWVIAANEFDHVVVTALSPGAEPVSADAELISRAGLSLGVVRLPVRPSAPFMTATAEPQPESQPAAPPPAEPVAAEQGKPEPTKPAKVHVHVRKTVAVADTQTRRKRHDARPVENAKATAKPEKRDAGKSGQSGQDADNAGSAEVETADSKPKGALSKFFAWITGKNKTATSDDTNESAASAFSLSPKE